MPSWIQDPKTLKLIPKEEYYRDQERGALQIMGDLQPFVSPVTGETIYTRSQLREHNRQHGVTNLADYGPDWFDKKAKERQQQIRGTKQQRIETILRAFAEHGG